MKIYDKFKAYVIEEFDDYITINKNNDIQYYEILESIDTLSNDTFCVLNHLYVNSGTEEVFEQKFLQRNKHLQDVEGFRALRFLRPKEAGRHYIIVTLWQDRQAFYNWQNSAEYAETHKNRGTKKGVDFKVVNRELSYNVRIELADLELYHQH
ncbi:antibiotic biosynthesis monooxygenase [Staphylococcus simiae]|uniref:antibiotic biosynthesis monooxygenase family protein n=1 Tax=Staphylococcus simiae TaxID=308354 RepID=UPI001A9573B6|nr:antibiotic biosynthesis monooxygenase [Staphylococcus simiae]MBO1199538.1 antibiotic biosynthesis monooxygenase [Staphylococcus simiae]MBO1201791.1 antibiotic biosynthesis monooxygenase [Staphylococcus simiae]MBO1203895.1 antibiotic biosynthesis monooxygenase [Staphylococcus simiae]MBO1211555.1 antibiotic biosynthesis monooxygenase [Staphylococcus simiae]MBO1230094.1 antibiotic biosynthesis monooxygenase [Staphylococcus simiae]